ncbi:hypothetical protein [Pseudomonas sp. Leaf58]|uniref:hypothetical protein n=1 Tax=Pseudomonas sp. Leaf58 TaxID=1736226 RepID=UPI000AB081EA|nr:hypothetical protein [Pseudomonas sp. Leaf58]
MTPTINPYLAYSVRRKLRTRSPREVLDPGLLMAVSARALDQFLRIMQVRAYDILIQDAAHFESLHRKACVDMRGYVDGLIVTKLDVLATESATNYLANQLHRSQHHKDYDWPDPQTFKEFVDALSEEDKTAFSQLLKAFTGNDCATVFELPHADWQTPHTIDEFKGAVLILGRKFVPLENGDSMRIDRFAQRYVIEEYSQREREDEGGFQTNNHLRIVGTAGTLAGAIEVAERSIERIAPCFSDVATPWGSPFPYRYKIIATNSNRPVLQANIEFSSRRTPEGFVLTPHNEWEAPLTALECTQVQLEIETVEKKITGATHSKSGYDHLNNRLSTLRDRLPAPGHTPETISTTLRQTLHLLGKEQALATLLEVDMGL